VYSPRPSPRDGHGTFRDAESAEQDENEARDDGPGVCPSGCSRESIYRFAIVYPELYRIKHRTYYSCDVCVAILLLAMTGIFQAYIVQIAGGHILTQSLNQYRLSVQTFSAKESEGGLIDGWKMLVGQSPPEWVKPIVGQDLAPQECCHAVSCSANIRCCDPDLNVKNREWSNETRIKPQHLSAVCYKDRDGLDCGPPSFQLVGRWNELDVDGDGLWSHEEALADRANLGCRLQLSQMELLTTVSLGITQDSAIKRELDLPTKTVPHEVKSMQAVPHEFFELWEGIAVICAVVDPARCGSLVNDGVFDGTLGLPAAAAWKLVNAIEYCGKLLMPGGVCDRTLPVTYALQRQSLANQCGQGFYSAGPLYVNPYNERDSLRAVQVSYAKVTDFRLVHTLTFRAFMTIMLVLWLVTLNKELESVFTMTHFCMNYPSSEDQDALSPLRIPRSDMSWHVLRSKMQDKWQWIRDWRAGELHLDGDSAFFGKQRITISDISPVHRVTCWCVWVLRLVNLFYMLAVGIVYATCTHSYVDLLMNTVALAFVFELPELFYLWLVPEQIKDTLNRVELAPFDDVVAESVSTKFFNVSLHGAASRARFVQGLALIPLICVSIVQANDVWQTLPMLEVLRCACEQSGPECAVGKYLQREWWNAYWNRSHEIISKV